MLHGAVQNLTSGEGREAEARGNDAEAGGRLACTEQSGWQAQALVCTVANGLS